MILMRRRAHLNMHPFRPSEFRLTNQNKKAPCKYFIPNEEIMKLQSAAEGWNKLFQEEKSMKMMKLIVFWLHSLCAVPFVLKGMHVAVQTWVEQ